MFRKFLLLISVLLICIRTMQAGWKEEADSLKGVLENESDMGLKADILIQLGNIMLSNAPEVAFSYFKQAKKIAENNSDTLHLINSQLGLSDYHSMTGDYSLAMDMVFHAMAITKGDLHLLSKCHNRLANIYYYLEDYEEALKHNRISLRLDTERGDTSKIAADLHNIGVYFLEIGNYDSALHYLYKAHYYSIAMDGKPDSYNLSHLGHTYTYMGIYDSALYYHFLAYYYDSLNNLAYEIAADNYYLAFTFYKLKEFDKALQYAQLSLEKSHELHLYDVILLNYEMLYDIYRQQGKYEKALTYALLRNDYADTLRDKNKQSMLQSLEAKYKFEEQQQLLSIAEEKNQLLEKQKNLWIILGIVGILLFISMVAILFLISKRHLANRKLLAEVEKADKAKEKLISVISHDLIGSIGTLRNAVKYTLDDTLDFESVKQMMKSFYPVVDSTYDLLENLLTWARYNKEKLDVNPEKFDIREICWMAIRHTAHLAENKKITVINQVEKVIVEADRNMLQTIMRNLISNAIKFSGAGSKVTISSSTSSSHVEIQISDEGVGISDEIVRKLFSAPLEHHTKGTMGERGSGLGLSICKTFIEKHGGEIWVTSKPGQGSSFFFSLKTV